MALSMESYFKVALNQFVGHFSQVCNDKEMQLTLKESGDAVKPDLLFRMMYELILSEEPVEDYKPPMSKTKIPEERERTEEQVPRASSAYTGIKVSYKDIKKVEKKAGVQFPFMPDFIDYKANNCCQCLRVCGNMFVPCGTHVKDWDPEDGTIPTCKTCANQKNEENYGNLTMRMEAYEKGLPYVAPFSRTEHGSEENVKGPKGPKKSVSFGTYLAKKGLLGDDPKHRTAKLNGKIKELEDIIFQETNINYSFGDQHLTIDKSKVRASKKSGDGEAKRGRGRPKKERSASVSSTSSEEEISSPAQSQVHEDPVEENVPEKENVPEDPKVEVEEDGELEIDEVSGSDVEEEEVNGSDVEEESVSDLEPAEEEPEPEPEKQKEQPKEQPKKEAEPEKQETKATKKLKKVTVNGKVLFIDRVDKAVYDENMQYYGEFDKTKGKIVPLK